MNDAAVLTGDLVLSEQRSRAVRKSIPSILRTGVGQLRAHGIATSDIDVFRGDAWQMVVTDPAECLRVALFIRAYCLSSPLETDTRVAIGVERLDGDVSHPVSTAIGPAFTLSGRTLDAMPRNRRIRVVMNEERLPLADASMIDASLHLLDRIVDQWTPAQARVTAGSLLGQSQEQIATAWTPGPISQQAVGQHLKRAAWHAVDHFVQAFSDLVRARTHSS